MFKYLLILSVALLAGCGPTCEEQGGKSRIVNYSVSVIMVGNVPVAATSPIYTCDMPEDL